MKATTRRKRAILRDRRLDNRDDARSGPPLIQAMAGWDLYVLNKYQEIRTIAQLVRPPWMTPEQMDQALADTTGMRMVAMVPQIFSGELPVPAQQAKEQRDRAGAIAPHRRALGHGTDRKEAQ